MGLLSSQTGPQTTAQKWSGDMTTSVNFHEVHGIAFIVLDMMVVSHRLHSFISGVRIIASRLEHVEP
eukprot:5351511-Amphidinium_carterae.2